MRLTVIAAELAVSGGGLSFTYLISFMHSKKLRRWVLFKLPF